MLKSITLENFYSFSNPTKIELNSGANVLVGINGTGKSNFLKSIELLYEAVIGIGLEKLFLRDWGGFDNVANFSANKDYIKLVYEFDKDYLLNFPGFTFRSNLVYEITIHKVGDTNYSLSEKLSVSKYPNQEPFYYLDIKNSRGQVSTRTNKKTGLQYYDNSEFKFSELVLRQLSDPERFFPLFTLRNIIDNIAVYGYFDTGKNSLLRKPTNFSIEKRLNTNGLNLASLLNDIKNNNSLDYDKIEDSLKKVNPNFKEIAFNLFSSNIILALREKELSKSVMVNQISDGTLRYVLLISIFYNPNRGHLICLDEPEIGLHPDMISMVCESLLSSTKNSQYFIATHSPIVLNSFKPEHLLIFEKDSENQSEIKKISNDEFLDKPLGQLWMSGILGGVRW